jgi:predicted nucleic acid-binding protein
MAANLVIFDSSVLVDHLRTGKHEHRISTVSGLIRLSAVVLSELWRGASKRSDQKFLEALASSHPILTPTQRNWQTSGEILSKIRLQKGFGPEKLRDLHFDVLIALTARSYGARLITTNKADFEMIAGYVDIDLEIW